MTIEPGHREYPVATGQRPVRTGFLRAWWFRLRLRHVHAEIDRCERRLADEFGLTETAPMHRELEALYLERDALVRSRVDHR